MFFRAELTNPNFSAGPESADVQLFEESQIPWDELAFPVIRDTLKHYFSDRPAGSFPVRVGDIRYKER
jgi:hypothetical protein